jgi:hypothetical protein
MGPKLKMFEVGSSCTLTITPIDHYDPVSTRLIAESTCEGAHALAQLINNRWKERHAFSEVMDGFN